MDEDGDKKRNMLSNRKVLKRRKGTPEE